MTGVAAIVALLAFVAAAVFVLLKYKPFIAQAPKADDLSKCAENNWNEEGWDQQVAIVMVR